MRTLTGQALSGVLARQTNEVYLVLLTLSHPSFAVSIRVTSDAVDTVSGGLTYQHFPFEIDLPGEDDSAPARVTLKIDNVDRRIYEEVRRIDSGDPIDVTFTVISASEPDAVQAGPFSFALRSVKATAAAVEGDLVYEDILNEPFPGVTFTPSRTPSLHQQAS